MKAFDMTLYLVTDRLNDSEEIFLNKVRNACEGGITLLQLREKEISGREYFELAAKIKKITDIYNIPLIIDDRIDIALAVDAAGVHVGQSDIPAEYARKLIGHEKILGVTAKTVEQAKKAEEAGADYLGVGAIYPTTTKVKTILTPVSVLDDIAREVSLPITAIGGLNASNMHVLSESEISGIAVVSAIMKAQDQKKAAGELKTQIFKMNGYNKRKLKVM